MAIIDNLKDMQGNVIYPKSKTMAIYEDETNRRLDHIIEGLEDGKVDKVTGKGLSESDYTTIEKTHVGRIPVIEAEVDNLQVDLVKHELDYATLEDRVDTIITTPVTDISVQEIVDARQGELSLGANLTRVKVQLADIAINVKSFGAKGDGTDDLDALKLAANEAILKNKVLMLPPGTYGIRDFWSLPPNITIKFNNAKLILLNDTGPMGGILTNVWNGGDKTTLFTENITLINPHVDANNIAGENAIAFANVKNINIYNPIVENCIHSSTRLGGRAFQFEGGSKGVKDCNVFNPTIRNSSIGINSQGTEIKPAINLNFFNVTMENVDIPFNFDSTTGQGALSHNAMNIDIDGFSLRNCGKSTNAYASALGVGILTSDRAYGVSLKNGKIFNDAAYGKIGGLVRGKGRNLLLENIELIGDVVALFNGDLRGFGSPGAGSIPAGYVAKNIRHFGSADYIVKGYAPYTGHMANCFLDNIETDIIVNGVVDINSTYATNSYGEFRRRSDNTKISLSSFKSIWDSGNGFVIRNIESVEVDNIKLIPANVSTGIYEISTPIHTRLIVEYVISYLLPSSGNSAGIYTLKGFLTIVRNGQGNFSVDESTPIVSNNQLSIVLDPISLNVLTDEINGKAVIEILQTNATDGNRTLSFYSKIKHFIGATPTKSEITLL